MNEIHYRRSEAYMKNKFKCNISYLILIINIILMIQLVESQQSTNISSSAIPDSKSLLNPANSLLINGTRYNDSNSNGVMDDGEKGLPGTIIRLMQNGTEISITITNEYGRYYFNNLKPGQYTIVEERVKGWNQTSPLGGSYNVTIAGTPIHHLDFGDTGGIITNTLYAVMYNKSTMNLSNDWVITPFGLRLRSNVHKIKQGDIMRIENGSLQEIDPSGKVVANYVAITPSSVNVKATPNTPNTPSPLTGRTRGLPGTPYSYSTSATDPDGDQVKYTFDWGDGTTDTTALVSSGTIASATHSWAINNVPYQVKARATDSTGASSGWSASLPVTIFSWVTDATWTKNAGDPIDSFTTNWKVPPAPTTQSDQVIFLFNGIQNSEPAIFQPVLQWGNNGEIGGNYWGVASWYVDSVQGGHSDFVQVNPEDTLVGLITRTPSQTGYNYNCQFQEIPETSRDIQNVPELNYFVQTLEAYNIKKASDFPATDITAFRDIGITAGSANPTVDWTVDNQVPDFGQYTKVISNANPGGEVDIHYGRDLFGYTSRDSNAYDGPTYNWIELSGDGTEVLPDSDDSYVSNIPLGFFFNYYGTDYSQLAISNNGLLFSGAGSTQYLNEPIKQSSAVHGFIALFWDDIVTWNTAGSIYYKTIGSAPNRMFVVEWYNNQHYHDSTSGITFEAILYEGSNNILFQYKSTSFGTVTGSTPNDLPPYDLGGSATVGIESPDGNDGLQYSYNDQMINPELAILYKFPQFAGTNLYLSKQAPASKDHGSTMTYTIHYHNFGDTAAQNVVLIDTLSNEVEYSSSSDGGSYDINTRKVTWNMGSIAANGHGYRTVTVSIPESVAVGTVIQNDASISTDDIEVRLDDNEAHTQTRVTGSNLPPNVGVEPNLGGTTPSIYWTTPITFSYYNPTATGVDIRIHLDDGGPDITGSMINGPPDWTYITTFYPRHGHATVTYTVWGGTSISFDIYIDPAGYIYNRNTNERIGGASVWLQRPDGIGGWENVPTGQSPPIMQPDDNPLMTNIDGQYQWDVLAGSYRVHVEAPGYYPADSIVVSIPPPITDLHVGLMPSTLPGTRFSSISSYEDLLRSQTSLISSFENLLKNTTLNSTMSYIFMDSFDDLADRQQHGLYSFEDLVSYNWSSLDEKEKISLTESFEDLLRRQAIILTSNEDLLKRGFCMLSTEDEKELLDRFEARLKSEMDLLKKFEDWLHYQQMIEGTEYETWMAFLASFEDLIRRQSNLLDSFEMLLKLDCTDEYINVTKSADQLHVQGGSDVTYTYTVTATNASFDVKDIVVKDSLLGEVGTIALLKYGMPQTLTVTKPLSCADCNNCICKVCNFATACGEVITPNGNFTVCDVSNEICAVVEDYDPCTRSGGTVVIGKCCDSATDFPDTCAIGPCGCPPGSSKDTKVCDCGAGKCFNGTACVTR